LRFRRGKSPGETKGKIQSKKMVKAMNESKDFCSLKTKKKKKKKKEKKKKKKGEKTKFDFGGV